MSTLFSTITKLFQDTYSQVITDSLTRRGIADANNFIRPTSLLAVLRDKGRVKIAGQSGDLYEGTQKAAQWKHQYASGQSGGSYAEGDAFVAAGDDSYESAEIDWRSLWEPVEVSGLALDTGQGASLVGNPDIWARRFEGGIHDLFDNVEDQLLTDGSGNAGADIDGITSFLNPAGTYAGISQAANAWWRAYQDDAAAAALTLQMLRDMKYEMNARKSNWDMILTSQIQVDKYRDLKEDKVRYTKIQMADIEREVPEFDGRPMIDIQGWPDGTMLFIDSQSLCLRFLPPKMDPSISTSESDSWQGMPLRLRYVQPLKDADQVQIITRCNLVCSNPYKAGHLINLATA